MTEMLKTYLDKRFKDFNPFPGSWQEELVILEAYNYCQNLEAIATYFGTYTELEIKAFIEDRKDRLSWQRQLSYLHARRAEDMATDCRQQLLETIITKKDTAQWHPERASKAVGFLNVWLRQVQKPEAPVAEDEEADEAWNPVLIDKAEQAMTDAANAMDAANAKE